MPVKDKSSQLIIYTDGGCRGNPGPGAWAFVVADGDGEHSFSGGESATTNNRMELTAAIEALRAASASPEWRGRSISMFCDSQYVKNGITSWIANWKKRGWKTANKKDVKNRDLWEKLDSLNSSLNVTWNWVRGHAGIKYNEMCDRLCAAEMEKFEIQP